MVTDQSDFSIFMTKGILTYAQAVKCIEFEGFSPRVQSVFFSYLVSTLVEKEC